MQVACDARQAAFADSVNRKRKSKRTMVFAYDEGCEMAKMSSFNFDWLRLAEGSLCWLPLQLEDKLKFKLERKDSKMLESVTANVISNVTGLDADARRLVSKYASMGAQDGYLDLWSMEPVKDYVFRPLDLSTPIYPDPARRCTPLVLPATAPYATAPVTPAIAAAATVKTVSSAASRTAATINTASSAARRTAAATTKAAKAGKAVPSAVPRTAGAATAFKAVPSATSHAAISLKASPAAQRATAAAKASDRLSDDDRDSMHGVLSCPSLSGSSSPYTASRDGSDTEPDSMDAAAADARAAARSAAMPRSSGGSATSATCAEAEAKGLLVAARQQRRAESAVARARAAKKDVCVWAEAVRRWREADAVQRRLDKEVEERVRAEEEVQRKQFAVLREERSRKSMLSLTESILSRKGPILVAEEAAEAVSDSRSDDTLGDAAMAAKLQPDAAAAAALRRCGAASSVLVAATQREKPGATSGSAARKAQGPPAPATRTSLYQAEQQAAFAARAVEPAKDAEMAQQLQEEELAAERLRQQELLAARAAEAAKDAEMAQRLHEEELAAERLQQQQAAARAAKEAKDAKLATRLHQQELLIARAADVARDAQLAQQLHEEDLAAERAARAAEEEASAMLAKRLHVVELGVTGSEGAPAAKAEDWSMQRSCKRKSARRCR